MANGTDIRSILDPLTVDQSVKAAAWDAFHEAKDQQDFKSRFDRLNLPREAKAALWDAKFARKQPSYPLDKPTGFEPLPSRRDVYAAAEKATGLRARKPGLLERAQKAGRAWVGDIFPRGSGGAELLGITGREAPGELGEERRKPLIPVGQMLRQYVQSSSRYDPLAKRLRVLAPSLADVAAGRRKPSRGLEYADAAVNTLLGVAQVGADTVQGLSTPENVAILASLSIAPAVGVPATIQRRVSAGFSYQQAKQAANLIVSGYQKYREGDITGAGEDWANSTVQATFAILAARAAGHPEAGKLGLKAAWTDYYKRSGLDETSAARAASVKVDVRGETDPPPTTISEPQVRQMEEATRERQKRETRVTPAGVTARPTLAHPEVPPGAEASMALPPLPERGEPRPEPKVVMVDPQSFIKKVSAEESHVSKPIVDDYRRQIREAGGKLPSNLKIRVDRMGNVLDADGRHRALAAVQEGVKQVPVEVTREVPAGVNEEQLSAAMAPEAEQPGPEIPGEKPKRKPKNFTDYVKQSWSGISGLLSPKGTTATTATKLRLRKAQAQIAADVDRASHVLDRYRRMFDRAKLPMAENLAFIDRYEGGGAAAFTDLKQVELARLWQDLQQRTWNAVRLRGGMDRWIDYYFPHMFKDENLARQIFGRRPLLGPRSWTHKRKFPTLKDALDFARENGVELEPAYDNPVDYMMNKLYEMNRYIHLYDFTQEMKALRIWQFKFGPPSKWEGMERIDDPVGEVRAPSHADYTLREAYDEILFNQMNDFAKSLGIDHIRKVKLRGGPSVWGYTIEGGSKVWTRFAGPEFVLTHELGHQLHSRYPELDALIKDPETSEELRALADLRYEGREDVSDYFKKYVRRGTEKIANLIHAYVHMRERARQMAPKTVARLERIIAAHDELRPLSEIHPGVVLGTAARAERIDLPGYRVLGHYYAPEPAARVVNRYLSPRLAGRLESWVRGAEGPEKVLAKGARGIYLGARHQANLLNQIQLGTVSFFHMTFTAMDTAASRWSLGLSQAARGEIGQAMKSFAKGNIVTAPIEALIKGNRMLEQFYGTDRGDFYRQAINQLIEAGGRVKMEDVFTNSSFAKFLKAWDQSRYAGAAYHALPATVEKLSWLTMQYWVPRLKMGTFAMLAEEELARLGPDASLWEQRGALARAWDSTDNRLGQVVQDDLHWGHVTEDLLHIAVRSVGWNYGTFRELGFGLIDIGKTLASRGKVRMTPRGFYTMALPIVVGLHGALLTYALTGKGPTQLLDYFYPPTGKTKPTGEPERVALPSYMGEEFKYGQPFRLGVERGMRGMAETFYHKANPELTMVMAMLRNKDFFGTKIRNEDDPFLKELWDSTQYIASQYQPFWLRNVERRKLAEGAITPRNLVESMFGIMPATRTVTETSAEALARDYVQQRIAPVRTKEQVERAQTRGELIRQFRTKQPESGKNLARALSEGKITARDRREILRSARMTPIEMMAEHLGLEEILNVYDRGTPEEKAKLKRMIRGKLHLIRGIRDPQKRQRLMDRVNRVLSGGEELEGFSELPTREQYQEAQPPP